MSKLQFKNPNDVKSHVDPWMVFEEGRAEEPFPAKLQGKDPNRSRLTSKYGRVLWCSFENEDVAKREMIKLP